MNATIRVAHMSDLHYSPSTLDEVDRCFASAIEQAAAESVDAIVLSGDLFDHRVEVHQECVSRLIGRVQECGNIAPTLILQGTFSHDQPGSLDVFRTIKARHGIYVADKLETVGLTAKSRGPSAWEPAAPNVEDYRAVALCLPPMNKAGMVAAGLDPADMGNEILKVLQDWAGMAETCRVLGIPSIVVSHGTVSGSLTEHGVPMVGLDHEYTTGALFAAKASAVMLGHIHKHQAWESDGRVIAYPGSIGRLHFGEIDPKGWILWEIDTHGSRIDFRSVPARQLLDAIFSGAPSETELRSAAAAIDPATPTDVRVRINIDEEHRSAVDREQIKAVFSAARELKIEIAANPVVRTRAAGINRKSDSEKFAAWCEITEIDPEPLLPMIARLGADPLEIAREEMA
ncbi:MAG: metallophosphatase family protein [Gammaproteobacteria bacterium]|nr:metallophosphatase family protein [Gammaproteobacteria bacterium]